ncbi:MAG: hypothetical protein Q8Q06_01495 [bacterium]|nr:hypothetical protein [bacterium]
MQKINFLVVLGLLLALTGQAFAQEELKTMTVKLATNETYTILNFATQRPTTKVVPGSLVTLFSENPLEKECNDLSFSFTDKYSFVAEGYMLYCWQRLIHVLVPNNISGSRVELRIISQNIPSEPITAELVSHDPKIIVIDRALFYEDGLVEHQDGHLVSRARPARPGETLNVYMTGLGHPLEFVLATVGGIDVQIIDAGKAPGHYGGWGFDRVVLRVPNSITGDLPLIVSSGPLNRQIQSNRVRLFVRQPE